MACFKHIDMSAAMQRLADRKIEQAMAEGKFDNLEGMGRPLDLEPMPAEENARNRWWAIRLLRKNNVVPDEVRYRRTIEALRESLKTAPDEKTLRERVGTMNEWIRKLNTMGANAIPSDFVPVDVESAVAQWRGGTL